ncbi:MAG: site-specific integrase, partial [Candidatus Hydrogenedentales bacterium]
MQDFVNYLETERNFSAHTIRAYLTDVAQFCRYIAQGPAGLDEDAPATEPQVGLLAKAQRNDIRAFLGNVQTRGA